MGNITLTLPDRQILIYDIHIYIYILILIYIYIYILIAIMSSLRARIFHLCAAFFTLLVVFALIA